MSYVEYQGPLTGWADEEFALAAYRQQLSYPQLLTAGRSRPERSARGRVAGLVHAVRALRRHRFTARARLGERP